MRYAEAIMAKLPMTLEELKADPLTMECLLKAYRDGVSLILHPDVRVYFESQNEAKP